MGKYVITKSPKGKYHFNLFAKNGEIVLSSQMYMARKGALKGIRSIAKNAGKAPVEDQTAKNCKVLGIPKFVIKKGKDGKFYFSLIANNGKAIGTSEGYSKLVSAKAGIKSVKTNAGSEIEKPAKKTAEKKPATKKAAPKKKVAKKATVKKAVKKVVKKVAKKAKKK